MSIKKSLQTSMMIVAGVPILIFAVLALVLTYNNYFRVTQEAIKATAENYQQGFEAQLNTQIIENEALATDNDILNQLLKKYNNPDIDLLSEVDSRSIISEKLQQSSTNFGNHVIYSVFDMTGIMVYSSQEELVGSFSHYVDDMCETLEKTQVNSTISLNNTDTGIHILSPITIKDTYIIGVMVASIDADYFDDFVSDSMNTYLLDNANNCLLNTNLTDTYVHLEAMNRLIRYTGDSEELHGVIFSGNFFSRELYGYSIMPEYRWVYVLKQDNAIYQSIMGSIPIILLVVILIFSIVTLLSSSALASQYTTPILNLKDKMLQASQGNLTVSCETDREDEFGELAEHFNDMMGIISNNYNELSVTKSELEEKQQELQENYDKIEKLAYTDTLTGLHNRLAFFQHARKVFEESNSFKKHAILFLDLDNFKNVNDTLGHEYGDLLLKQVSQKLTSYMSEEDFLARTGGDEFLVLCNKVTSKKELQGFAEKLISIVEHPFDLEGEIAHVSMSVGIAIYPENGLTSTELVKNADIAMYSAKTSGKNAFRFFQSSMEDEVHRKNTIEEGLHGAIERKDVYLMYQPKFSMKTGLIIGCEALMRLNNSYLGNVSPAEFIPIAEETGMIHELGTWALQTACALNKQLIDRGLGPITMSVNASIEQLRAPGFLDTVKDVLFETGLAPEYLELEVTESILMQDYEKNIAVIHQLREMGIRIALDDFGTGYSSFNYLTRMPIDTLKMDKSFIDNISTNSKDCYVAETIIQLAHKLHVEVVAEGVETTDQLSILKANNCDIIQGYIFSRPLMTRNYSELVENINLRKN